MINLSDFDNVVLELMHDFGFTATYVQQVGDGAYDPTTGKNTITTVEIPVQALMFDFLMNTNGLSPKFGTMILAGDKDLYIRPPEKTDPTRVPLVINHATDDIRINNVTYNIVNMKEINPSASNVVLYNLHIRR